jgi:hypothetical protein
MSSRSTPWVLVVGVNIWLASAAVTLTGFFRSRYDLPEPRPGHWSMRFMLIHDTVHARSTPGRRPSGPEYPARCRDGDGISISMRT